MKEVFGAVSVLIASAGYIPYIKDILTGKTKPHAFSWLVWAVLAGIAVAIQLTHNAGAGAWHMGLTALVTFFVFLLSLKFGEGNIVLLDWLCLSFAGFALAIWFITDRPLISVVLLALIDMIGGFLPTLRKSIANPHEETASTYFMYAVSLCFALAALDSFSLVNALYPATFVFVCSGMGTFLIMHRKKTQHEQT